MLESITACVLCSEATLGTSDTAWEEVAEKLRVLERAASLLAGPPSAGWTKAKLGRLAPAPSAMLREGGPFFAPALESVPTTGTVDEAGLLPGAGVAAVAWRGRLFAATAEWARLDSRAQAVLVAVLRDRLGEATPVYLGEEEC